MNYHTGERETFGRAGRPRASFTNAVMASCAAPAWYQPVPIGEVPYVDGALCSPCNADLLAGADLDEVYVLAPMASFAPDRPRGPLARLERASRRVATRQTLRELSLVRAAGSPSGDASHVRAAQRGRR